MNRGPSFIAKNKGMIFMISILLIIASMFFSSTPFGGNDSFTKSIASIHKHDNSINIDLLIEEDNKNNKINIKYQLRGIVSKSSLDDICTGFIYIKNTSSKTSSIYTDTSFLKKSFSLCSSSSEFLFSYDQDGFYREPISYLVSSELHSLDLEINPPYYFPYDNIDVQILVSLQGKLQNNFDLDWNITSKNRSIYATSKSSKELDLKLSRPPIYSILIIILIPAILLFILLTHYVNDINTSLQVYLAIFFGIWSSKQIITPSYIEINTHIDYMFVYIYLFFIIVSIFKTISILSHNKGKLDDDKLLYKLIMYNKNKSNI